MNEEEALQTCEIKELLNEKGLRLLREYEVKGRVDYKREIEEKFDVSKYRKIKER